MLGNRLGQFAVRYGTGKVAEGGVRDRLFGLVPGTVLDACYARSTAQEYFPCPLRLSGLWLSGVYL